MTLHWIYVLLSWGAVLGVFTALAISVMVRHRAARRQLAQLERTR